MQVKAGLAQYGRGQKSPGVGQERLGLARRGRLGLAGPGRIPVTTGLHGRD